MALAALGAAGAGRAEQQPGSEVRTFLERLWPAAQTRGITRDTFERATAGFLPDPEVIEIASRQPEHIKTPGTYLTDLVTEARIDAGRRKAAEFADVLVAIEAAHGVDRHVLIAVWGIESAYGSAKGSRSVIRSLATLAMLDARRAPYWTKELLAALRILQDGGLAPHTLRGSWAGAMGHTQFMPSTYGAHAVDFDKDGRRDVWETPADALASTASFLRAAGWVAGLPWGFEVALPPDFDFTWSAPGRSRTLAEWQADGVQLADARDLPPVSKQTWRLILPAGAGGPAFLVSRNFQALLKYNPSGSYALTVGHLAQRIAGTGPLAAAWPAGERGLTRAEREELQALLASQGHDTGGRDGVIGDRTQAAIRASQRTHKLVEDGYPNTELLRRLRANIWP